MTATTEKQQSGCNGSLRLQAEITNENNDRLGNAVEIVQAIVADRCMTFADGLLFAMAVAVDNAGGPNIIAEVIDVNAPRSDVDESDTVDGEVPSRNGSFETLAAFYTSKGFTVTDMVSSCAAAHSLGGVQQGNRIDPFAPIQTEITSLIIFFFFSSTENK